MEKTTSILHSILLSVVEKIIKQVAMVLLLLEDLIIELLEDKQQYHDDLGIWLELDMELLVVVIITYQMADLKVLFDDELIILFIFETGGQSVDDKITILMEQVELFLVEYIIR